MPAFFSRLNSRSPDTNKKVTIRLLKREKERLESRGAPATLKGYMIKLNQLA